MNRLFKLFLCCFLALFSYENVWAEGSDNSFAGASSEAFRAFVEGGDTSESTLTYTGAGKYQLTNSNKGAKKENKPVKEPSWVRKYKEEVKSGESKTITRAEIKERFPDSDYSMYAIPSQGKKPVSEVIVGGEHYLLVDGERYKILDGDEGEKGKEGEGEGEGESEGEGAQQNGEGTERLMPTESEFDESDPNVYRYQPTKYRLYGKTKYPELTAEQKKEMEAGLMGYIPPSQKTTAVMARRPKQTWNTSQPKSVSESIKDPSVWSTDTLSLITQSPEDFDAVDSKYRVERLPDGRTRLTSEETENQYYTDSVVVRKDGTFTVKPSSMPVPATSIGMDPGAPLTARTSDAYFNEAYNKMAEAFRKARVVVYMLGGFSLLAFGVAAFFGKLSWIWLVMITISLFILASTEAIIAYAHKAGDGDPGVITSTWASGKFNNKTGDKLQLRNDSTDFDYNQMLKNSPNATTVK